MSLVLNNRLILGKKNNSVTLSTKSDSTKVGLDISVNGSIIHEISALKSVFTFTVSNDTITLFMNKSILRDESILNIAGIQLYVSGVQLDEKITNDKYVETKNDILQNWIVACNTINNNLSIIYLEMDDDSSQIDVNDDGIIELCILPLSKHTDHPKIYNTAPFNSIIVELSPDNTVITPHTYPFVQ